MRQAGLFAAGVLVLAGVVAIGAGCGSGEESTDLFPGAESPGYSGDCGGKDIVGRYTMNYDYASMTDPGQVSTGSKSEWHIHTQKGCFVWGLGLWSKPEEEKRGCVNWLFLWEKNGEGPLVGMYKDVAGDRFLGYGRFDPKTSLGVVWDQFGDPKMEAVFMNKSTDETLYTSCEEALEGEKATTAG